MKILSIVGARPQLIKIAPIAAALERTAGVEHFLLHTGQHYDPELSRVFFEELNIPKPDANLGIGSGSHAKQTGQMLIDIEGVLVSEQPDCVLVYGDTNSTLAGALATVKLGIPLAHIEAGLRSYNRRMPEEHNRVLADHCSDLLFAPTQSAVENLRCEGLTKGVHLVGDVMYDAVLRFSALSLQRSTILDTLHLKPGSYLLLTLHRAHNSDNPLRLGNILFSLGQINERVVFPIHPRTLQRIREFGLVDLLTKSTNLLVIDPVSYLDMLMLEQKARRILTDSGGVQKEAYFFGVPCVTLRAETEWLETLQDGWNVLVDADPKRIQAALDMDTPDQATPAKIFGDGNAANKIVDIITQNLQVHSN